MADDVPELRHDGVTYRLPFRHLFRRHTPAERTGLVTSVTALGVLVRVVTYDSNRWGPRCVIDGGTRLKIAAELQRVVPVHHRGRLDDARAEREAVSLNTDRRQLTPDEVAAYRAQRNADICADRIEGDSFQIIADRFGLTRQTVFDICEAAGVSRLTPERVTGADGKSYPSASGRKGEHTPEQFLARAQRAVHALRAALDALLAGFLADRLRVILTRHDTDVETLALFEAVIADLAAEIAAGPVLVVG